MKGKANGYWSKRLAGLTEKRNRQMRDATNKAARKVIQHCLDNQIGTVIFGWNKGQKESVNMGSKTNQKFVQIPTGRLKDRIAQLCEQYGLRFVEAEESYFPKLRLSIMTCYLNLAKNPKGGFLVANELSAVCTERLKVG